MAGIIDGKLLSADIKENLKEKVSQFESKYARRVTLAVVLIGSDPASQIYVKNKIKAAEYVGIKSLSFSLPETATQVEAEALVKSLADNDTVDGILVQLPLPKHLDSEKILALIPAVKDVDGFTAENVGNLTLFKDGIVACTPAGIMYMLKSAGVSLASKHAVVIGRSNTVGKPVALLLLRESFTVTVCHSKTVGIKDIVKSADIVIAAVGKAKFVTADMVKDGAVVIDVGINRTETGIVGDVDFDGVKEKASFITPVPGGVGPMTVAMLMENAYKCAVNRENGRF